MNVISGLGGVSASGSSDPTGMVLRIGEKKVFDTGKQVKLASSPSLTDRLSGTRVTTSSVRVFVLHANCISVLG